MSKSIAALLLLPSLFWPILEYTTIQAFAHGSATYDWRIETLSDLGIDYKQVHPLKHYTVTSFYYQLQNANFVQAGVLIALGQILLSRRSGGRLVRILLAVLFALGMILMALVHAGPRENIWGVIGWHWMGFAMAAGAGNLMALLAALISGRKPASRLLGFVLGAVGLYSFYRFQTLGTWNFQTRVGLWQRGAIYPILVWNALTAWDLFRAGGGVKAKKG